MGTIYFNRYMRYTPSVAVLLLFMLSFIPYALVNGPSIRLLTTNVERCQKYWWSTLLMIQNYVNVDQVVSFIFYVNSTCEKNKLNFFYFIFSVFRTCVVFECRPTTLLNVSSFHLYCLEI